MQIIELEKYKPSQDDPRKLEYDGQRTGREVFAELKQRLENAGLLPDEYFLIGREWEHGEDIPKGADLFVTTDYGGSEGCYLDIYLKWYEDSKSVTKSFATGKTLGETGADLDRMFLISSAITKAFHGDRGQYDRYQTLHPEQNAKDMIVSLSPAEHKLFVDALIEHREKMLHQVDGTEQLLRRLVGNITEYMDVVGERPLHISDYDRASLAIRDGDLNAFKELYPRVPGRADDLLIEAAGRCGDVGRKMMLNLLVDVEQIDNTAYFAAGRAAIETGDTERVRCLMEQAETHMEKRDMSFYGETIGYALENNNLRMAKALIEDATPEQIAAAPASLLYRASTKDDFPMMLDLIRKGARPGEYARHILQPLTYENRNTWIAERYLEAGMQIDPDDYDALYTCIKNSALPCAKQILDQGMDFQMFQSWADRHGVSVSYPDAMIQLAEYWVDRNPEQQEQSIEPSQGPVMGGMSL